MTQSLSQREVALALRFAWVASKRFPQDIFARNGLAEVLKAAHRYDEAETVYRQTIKDFPQDIVARNGLADTLRRSLRWGDAEEEYRAVSHPDTLMLQLSSVSPIWFSGIVKLVVLKLWLLSIAHWNCLLAIGTHRR